MKIFRFLLNLLAFSVIFVLGVSVNSFVSLIAVFVIGTILFISMNLALDDFIYF